MLLFGLLVWLVGRTLIHNLDGVHWGQVHVRWGLLAAAWAIRLVQMAVAVTALRMLLGRMCPQPPWPVMFGVITVSSIGKYIPGRLAGLVGGLWMFRRRNVPVPAATGMIVMSRGLSVCLDLLIVLPLLLWQPISQRLPLAWLWSLVLVAAVLTCLHPRVFLCLGNWVLRRFRQMPLEGTWRSADYLRPLALLALNAVLGGVGLWLTTRSTGELSPGWIPVLISAGSLTSVAALLAVFAPGGLGVSEGVLLIVMGQIVSPARCAIVVIASRLMWTLTDAVLALGGWLILRVTDRRQPVESTFEGIGSIDANPADQ